MSKAMTTLSEFYELRTTVINKLNVQIAKSKFKHFLKAGSILTSL